MKIVAISGRMHSGKSYVSDILVREHGYFRHSFAAALKSDLAEMGFSPIALIDKPPWMRTLMQAYGMARRAMDSNYWVGRLLAKLVFCYREKAPALIVIDDMRFENEAEGLRQFAADTPGCELLLVRLEREGYDYSQVHGADNESETALDEYKGFHRTLGIQSGDLRGLEFAAALIVKQVNDGRTPSAGSESVIG